MATKDESSNPPPSSPSLKGSPELEKFFALSLDLICIAGIDGYFKKISKEFSNILGYSEPEILKTPFIDFVHPADREKTIQEVQKLSQGIPTVDLEIRYRRIDDTYRVIRWKATPDPETSQVFAIGTDVTGDRERQLVQGTCLNLRSLARSPRDRRYWDSVLALLVESLDCREGVILSCGNFQEKKIQSLSAILNCSHSALEEFAEEIFQKLDSTPLSKAHPFELSRRGDAPAPFLIFPLAREGSLTGALAIHFKDYPSKRQHLTHYTILGQTISDLLNAYLLEANLIETEQFNAFYKIALDQAAIVAFTDPAGRITYANEMFCSISEYAREELIGRDHRILNSGKMGKPFFRKMWETIKGGEQWNGEICNRSKTGKEYWVNTTIVPFKTRTGEIEKFIAIRRDITKEKQQHQALENAYRNAEKAAQAKSEFLADISHKIRTPLNSMIGAANLLAESTLNDDQKKLLTTLLQSAKTLLGMIQDNLD